ncbi:dehypoxanthine futalosine cyclase [candidate division TA06 bacterium]|nr:dehypoxanthine futalosine cyclase [candidate division TA06 bacterium]
MDRGERITFEEGCTLMKEAELLEVGALANRVKKRFNFNGEITFVIDTNPNYTNICNVDCVFCAFYRHPEDEDAYTLTVEQVLEKVGKAAEKGVTTVLLQGGVNPALPLDYYLDLVRGMRERFPQVQPHFFSAPEIQGMMEVSGLTLREVLMRLKKAGQRTIPGGGAEILADRVRVKMGKKKGLSEAWLEVHREAHRVGFKSTATMMYGHVETDEEIIEHLEKIRSLQDETGGFTAFIPWSFKPGNTPLEKKIPQHASANRYLRIMGVSRIYLDNYPHIQASWFSEGKKTGQIALHFGADDFGGTIFEEEVHRATGHVNTTTVDEVIALIRESGFQPVQRTTLYEKIRYY